MPHARPPERFLEDFHTGEVYEVGEVLVDEAEVIAFAERFDPQYFHIDREQALHGPFGGLTASGWHTCSMMMRLLVDRFLPEKNGLGSPGMEQIRWPHPVRPGDRLSGRVTIGQVRRSESKPDRGLVELLAELTNQDGRTVMTWKAVMFVRARAPA